jgi:hypothetical protein
MFNNLDAGSDEVGTSSRNSSLSAAIKALFKSVSAHIFFTNA